MKCFILAGSLRRSSLVRWLVVYMDCRLSGESARSCLFGHMDIAHINANASIAEHFNGGGIEASCRKVADESFHGNLMKRFVMRVSAAADL